jgi:hypothetical protein
MDECAPCPGPRRRRIHSTDLSLARPKRPVDQSPRAPFGRHDALGRAAIYDGNHAASPSTVAEPKASAAALYNAMRDALRRGDWTAFGRAFEALGRLLGQPPKP